MHNKRQYKLFSIEDQSTLILILDVRNLNVKDNPA